ncbi:MAG: cell wall-binding repeat-containing protein [Actinomycetota bacterium]|nr:MAG: N-acetylmuramoyl-L-alanine amidase family 2 [Actinomycetota bacterium]MDO8949248.1 cell wall-binding repeat-containing protein [Actinomycetota bacterium]MDP3629649.1 cell wall-binding repeat-containing protein [Actinomycetota bacterium]
MAFSRVRVALITVITAAIVAPVVPAYAQPWSRSGADLTRAFSLVSLVTPAGVDDDVPGIPLDSYPIMSRTVTGTLDAYPIALPPKDRLDVYSIYLAPGEQLELGLTGPAGNFDLELLGPATTSVNAPRTVVISENPDSTESICYTAADLFGAGRYYIVVRTGDSVGEYELIWKLSGRSDGNIPGVLLESSSLTGTVNALTDADDVYRLPLDVGQTLSVTLTADVAGDAVGLAVLPPVWDNAGTLETSLDVWRTGDAVAGEGTEVNLIVNVEPDRAGMYYLDVYAPSGSSGYTLEWSVSPQLIPGLPLAEAPAESRLETRTVYSIPLRYGDTFKGTIDASPGVQVNARLLKPGSLGPDRYLVAWANTTTADPKSFSYVVPQGAEGTYYLELTPLLPGPVRLDWSVQRATTRVQGLSRYETVSYAAAAAFPDGSDVVIVASGADFPDALAAAGLAGAYDAPLLLTRPDSVPAAVGAEIQRLGATRCFIVGGTGAVFSHVETALRTNYGLDVLRIAGGTRYDTAAEVARRVVDRLGPDYDGGVFVARGDVFADALAAAPLAWTARRPIVLSQPTALPDVTATVLDEIGAHEAVVVGGTSAVSNAVQLRVASIVGSASRVAGRDRFDTAARVAAYGVDSGITTAAYVGVATGLNFPDALGGGIASGAEGGVLLLTPTNSLSLYVASFLRSHAADVRWCRVYGSPYVVSNAAVASLNAILRP